MKEKYPMMEIIDKAGKFVSKEYEKEITKEQAQKFYYHMLRIRTFDRKGKALQRQGRIGTYVHFDGQESKQVGCALVLYENDWMLTINCSRLATFTLSTMIDRSM